MGRRHRGLVGQARDAHAGQAATKFRGLAGGENLGRAPRAHPLMQFRGLAWFAVCDEQWRLQGARQTGRLQQQPARLCRRDDHARRLREERVLQLRGRAARAGEGVRDARPQPFFEFADAV